MRVRPPRCYGLETFRSWLAERGPQWIITGDGVNAHARLLVGMYLPDEDEEHWDATVFELIDPQLGTYVYEDIRTFREKLDCETEYLMKLYDERGPIAPGESIFAGYRWQVLSY